MSARPDPAAWKEISDCGPWWTAFTDRYGFRPGVDPSTWPAIREPVGSVTFDLSPVWSDSSVSAAKVDEAVLLACQTVCGAEEFMVVLDWQHHCYDFWPHRFTARPGQTWPVPPTPDGDYFLFLAQDMSQGSFGHPWERSLCVFGAEFTAAVVPALASLLPVLRRG